MQIRSQIYPAVISELFFSLFYESTFVFYFVQLNMNWHEKWDCISMSINGKLCTIFFIGYGTVNTKYNEESVLTQKCCLFS